MKLIVSLLYAFVVLIGFTFGADGPLEEMVQCVRDALVELELADFTIQELYISENMRMSNIRFVGLPFIQLENFEISLFPPGSKADLVWTEDIIIESSNYSINIFDKIKGDGEMFFKIQNLKFNLNIPLGGDMSINLELKDLDANVTGLRILGQTVQSFGMNKINVSNAIENGSGLIITDISQLLHILQEAIEKCSNQNVQSFK